MDSRNRYLETIKYKKRNKLKGNPEIGEELTWTNSSGVQSGKDGYGTGWNGNDTPSTTTDNMAT